MAKRFDKLFTGLALSTAVILAACQSGGGSTGGNQPQTAMASLAGDMRDAYCEGRSDDIIALLRGEPLTSPADRFYLALSLEDAGYALQARDIYKTLAARRDAGSINVACGGSSVVQGSVADVSLTRLTALNLKLENFDIMPGPAVKLHSGLPVRDETASSVSSSVRRPKLQPDPSITAPASASASGLFFAHLTSYRAEENVATGISQLAVLYPGLAGVLGSWQTDTAQGPIWRVGVRTIDFNDAESVCSQVERGGAYCRVLDTTQ